VYKEEIAFASLIYTIQIIPFNLYGTVYYIEAHTLFWNCCGGPIKAMSQKSILLETVGGIEKVQKYA
jgi:hypothetical protein